jgi:hypothetical protein
MDEHSTLVVVRIDATLRTCDRVVDGFLRARAVKVFPTSS